jgi:hypothetical protein
MENNDNHMVLLLSNNSCVAYNRYSRLIGGKINLVAGPICIGILRMPHHMFYHFLDCEKNIFSEFDGLVFGLLTLKKL